MNDFCPELSHLRHYVVLNYTGVVKAVKKWNKNLGKQVNAVQLLAGQPIFNSLGLAKLVTRAEMLAVHTAPAAARTMEDFVCPLCKEVLNNPVILPCKHRFCFKCIATAALKSSMQQASEDDHDGDDDNMLSRSVPTFSSSFQGKPRRRPRCAMKGRDVQPALIGPKGLTTIP